MRTRRSQHRERGTRRRYLLRGIGIGSYSLVSFATKLRVDQVWPWAWELAGRHVLVHDDRYRIVQDTLTENDRVELGVNFVLVENGQDRHRIRRREGRTENQTFEKCKLESFQTEERPDVD